MLEKKDLEKLVIQNKKSSLKNHWNDSFSINRTKYSGEIRKDEILLWSSSFFLRGAYPIYHLIFNENQHFTKLKIKKNPYHTLINKIFILLIITILILLIITSGLKNGFIGGLGVLFVLILLNLILKRVRKYETRILTEELKSKIHQIENKKMADE